jgi:thiosulfate dehydrogenase
MTDGELLAWLDGSANSDHDFSTMGEAAMGSLVKFIQSGVMDISGDIDSDTKEAAGGDPSNGQTLYESTCTACHGADGRMINFGDDDEPEYVGTIAQDNPWEFIHKVRAGQPGSQMPSAIENDWAHQDVVDVLAYAQTLPLDPPPPGSVSRGGRLYDKWWSVLELDAPTEDHPIWASQTTNERSGADTWRCKECHGWDYLGSEGAYGSGSHFTGFPGVYGAQDRTVEELVSFLSGEVDANHDFSTMDETAKIDVASFLGDGLLDLRMYIDPETKTATEADAARGEALYTETCAVCHGPDGLTLNFGDEDDPEFVSTIAIDNPWEFVHKVRFGQPGSSMPSAIDSEWSLQDVLDVLAFSQTLPNEAP